MIKINETRIWDEQKTVMYCVKDIMFAPDYPNTETKRPSKAVVVRDLSNGNEMTLAVDDDVASFWSQLEIICHNYAMPYVIHGDGSVSTRESSND